MSKLDEFHEKRELRKERRKERREKFKEKHPWAADMLLNVEVGLGVLAIFAVPYFAGRSSKFEEVNNEAELRGYLKASNDFSNEYGRESIDFIDVEGKYHQDLHFGAYAIWPSAEAYLDAEKQRLDALNDEGYPR